MAQSVVSIAAERLGDLLVQEAKFLHGVSGQIELIQLELELMQTYLEDADKRQIQDKRVQTWISKIRETAYDVEDILETFILKIASRRRGGIKNAFKRYACMLNKAAELHKVGSHIEDIKTRITTLTRCLKTYGIKHTREGEEGPSSVIERQRQWRQSYSHVDEEYTVGLEGDIKKLVVEYLLNEEKQCRVVSICGMGGLGKTTLAKKVYRHQDIRRHFDGLAWVFISQQFQPRNIWEGILFDLISPSEKDRERIKNLRDEEVAKELSQVQQDKKCLVILDDIWTKEAWDDLRGAFPVGNSGSKILLTSRYDEVAEHVDPRVYLHKPLCLTEEEGWLLLQKKAFPEVEDWSLLQKKAFPEGTVGLEGVIKKLVEELLNEEKQRRVVSICGMGGLGKTTLAKKIYHHKDIRRHFDCFAWAFISQQSQPRNILEGILFELISLSKDQREAILKYTDVELVAKLYQVQQDKKCLVILDDIWTMEAWDSLSHAFSVRNKGSKILLTTSNEEVAVHVDPRGYHHKLQPLTEEDSWSLFQKKAFPEGTEYAVGLEGDVSFNLLNEEKLVEELLNEEKQRRVVSIYGMGGLGKTTLAKKVYQHQEIRRRFDGFAWVFISHQQFQPRNIWEGILFELISPSTEEREEILKSKDAEVAEKLYQVQKKKKCLVILDDIWTMEAWDSLRRAFPLGNSGSKILLTTRNEEVAVHVDPRGYHHKLQPLTEEDSWSLLQEKAFPEGSDGKVDEVKKLVVEMVKRCAGLPFAIAMLGRILATKPTNEWKMVHDNIGSYLRSGKGHEQQQLGVNEILALSYYELPYQLKPCFLYLGHFPKDFNIPTKKLVRMWVAEGLLSPMQYEVKGAKTLEEVAECYLGELLNRNMVQAGEIGSTGRVKTCRLHDLMREVCLSKANEENFFEIIYNQDGNELMSGSLSSMVTNAKPSHRIRRIAIQYKEVKGENFSLKRERVPYLRSLLVHGASVFESKMVYKLCNFKLLKVLDLEPSGFGMLPRAIGDLIHLRYLNFKYFTEPGQKVIIPSSISNLRCLQTLIINIDCFDSFALSIFEVPNVLWKMERLRHLCLPYHVNKNCVKLRLGDLRELQTLKSFDVRNFDVKELTKLTNLRKLFLKGKIVKLPEDSIFPPNLTKLSLEDSALEEDPMPTLEKLHNLTVLSLRMSSFKGKQMTCSANGFPQLKFLQLRALSDLEEWCVQEEAMRSLCKLEIERCQNLKMFSKGLWFITTLRELHITRMPEEFEKRVKEGGEDYDNLKHVPSIILKNHL